MEKEAYFARCKFPSFEAEGIIPEDLTMSIVLGF